MELVSSSTHLTISKSQRSGNVRDQWEDIESNVGFYMSSGKSLSVQNMRLTIPHIEGSQVVLYNKNEKQSKIGLDMDSCKASLKTNFMANDVMIFKPSGGSRLFQVLKLLPEFGGEI
ncbi:hypothetical protein POM88_029891 [Heracleum sosnowskyi]|uniref:Uncharacterized protein n=1 Tax=Heracleum sosnowskyi TaxID=360622 RepID=A0AAD8MIW7_9APIA|nr:hypothetical protein POM88_029891 [Heracleum sosnowskyi]